MNNQFSVLFNKVPENYQSDGEFFKLVSSPDEFYFVMEVLDEEEGNGTFTISDTCGRFMPFDFETLDSLITTLTTLKEYKDNKAEFNECWKEIWGSSDFN